MLCPTGPRGSRGYRAIPYISPEVVIKELQKISARKVLFACNSSSKDIRKGVWIGEGETESTNLSSEV